MSDTPEKTSFVMGIGDYISGWYRVSRILFSGFATLIISAVIAFPVFYLQIEKEDNSTFPFYLLIIMAGGIYGTCWWAFVGFDRDTENPSYGGQKAGWLGLLALLALVALIGEAIWWFMLLNGD